MNRNVKLASPSHAAQLGDEALAAVSGGLNPQPIPPGFPGLDLGFAEFRPPHPDPSPFRGPPAVVRVVAY
jgi:hypothetical protein